MSSPIATPAAAAAGGSGPGATPDGGDGPQDLRLLWSMIWIPAAILLLLVLLPLGVNLAGGWLVVVSMTAVGFVPCALCLVPCALCLVPCALCLVPCALCLGVLLYRSVLSQCSVTTASVGSTCMMWHLIVLNCHV
jgi:hypothetical protein